MTYNKHALITGAAGFIGSHLADSLIADGWRVTALDNFDPFYDRSIKLANIQQHVQNPNYRLVECDIRDRTALGAIGDEPYSVVVHLAARAGVRPSIADPLGYQEVNVGGTQNMLEFARKRGIRQFIFASSSSVYGISPDVPWKEDDPHLRPISPYASTKLSGEFLGHVYSHLYQLRFIGLRFFTVYGPRQRPDLAIYKFAQSILAAQTIPVFGDGSTSRDYTYVGDIVGGIRSAIEYDHTSFEIFNLGNHKVVRLFELIAHLEHALGQTAQLEYLAEQPGDVKQTWANIEKASALLGYEPKTSLQEGLQTFAAWLHDSRSVVRSSMPIANSHFAVI